MSFVPCTYPDHQFHILYIFWTLHQFNVACFYSCLLHFLFYKVNFILLQKYLHVTTVTVGIWMHEYLLIILSNLFGKSRIMWLTATFGAVTHQAKSFATPWLRLPDIFFLLKNFFNQKHMLDIFGGICTTPLSKIKWSTPF